MINEIKNRTVVPMHNIDSQLSRLLGASKELLRIYSSNKIEEAWPGKRAEVFFKQKSAELLKHKDELEIKKQDLLRLETSWFRFMQMDVHVDHKLTMALLELQMHISHIGKLGITVYVKYFEQFLEILNRDSDTTEARIEMMDLLAQAHMELKIAVTELQAPLSKLLADITNKNLRMDKLKINSAPHLPIIAKTAHGLKNLLFLLITFVIRKLADSPYNFIVTYIQTIQHAKTTAFGFEENVVNVTEQDKSNTRHPASSGSIVLSTLNKDESEPSLVKNSPPNDIEQGNEPPQAMSP